MVGLGTGDGDDEEKQFYPDEQVDEQTNRSSSRGEGVEDVEEKKAGMAGAEGQGRTKAAQTCILITKLLIST